MGLIIQLLHDMNKTSFLAASYHLLLVCSSSSTNLTRNILQRFVTVAVSNLPLSLHFIPRGAKLPSLRLLTPPHNHSRYDMRATRSLRSRRGVDPQPLQPAKAPGTETTPRSQARPRQPLPGPTRATGNHGRPVVLTKLRPTRRAPRQPPEAAAATTAATALRLTGGRP